MYNLVICDDDPRQLRELEAMLPRAYPEQSFRVYTFSSAEELLRAEGDGLLPHILLMDIAIGKDSGIELVKQLNLRMPEMQVIYITAFINYCTEVYETEHLYFLTKPIKEDDLRKALTRALENLNLYDVQTIVFKDSRGLRTLTLNSIYYIETIRRKLVIHCAAETIYETYGGASEIAAHLDERFIQCHRCYIVNMDAVQALKNYQFILKNDQTIPVSKRRYAAIKQRFMDYVGAKVRKRPED